MPRKSSKTARRARGTGSIFFDSRRNLWVARKPVGRSSKGHTQYQEVTARTQAAVIDRLKKIQPPTESTTVAEWGRRWLESLSVRPQTRDSYANSLHTRIIPSLGHLPVARVTPYQVESAARSWIGAGASANSAILALSHLRILFNAARRAGIATTNPVSLAQKPRATRKKMDPFTPAELARIISHAPPAVAIMAATGIRKGEAAALDVEDYDRQANTLAISKTMTRKYGIGPPKSPHSERTITVPHQAVAAVLAAIGGRAGGPLFRGENGRITVSAIDRQWRAVCRALNLRPRNPHQLRHSVATAMSAAGLGVPDIARYLGDTPEIVVRTYLHPSETDPADSLTSLFAARKVSRK